MRILVTGSAGFIGYYLSKILAEDGQEVYGIDSLNSYYDVVLKKARLRQCGIEGADDRQERVSRFYPGFRFLRMDLCDRKRLEQLFQENAFDCVVNLAAQAGVRYSLLCPESYVESNVVGFLNLLECCRQYHCKRLIYASSSSVYGNTQEVPFREDARVDYPESLYAATKKSDELMAFTYSALYGLHAIGLRFFTVYGPWGRPDMAPMLFADAICQGKTIQVFNKGHLFRDFTYVGDIVEGMAEIIRRPEVVREDRAGVPAAVYNIGHGSPVALMDFIHTLEQCFGKEVQKEFVEMQAGDVYRTWADTGKLQQDYGYTPSTSLEEGIRKFADWYISTYISGML